MNRGVIIFPFLLLFVLGSCNILKKPSRKNVTVDSTAAVVDSTVAMVDTLPVSQVFPGQTEVDPTLPSEATYVPDAPALSPEKQQLVDVLLPIWNKRIDYRTFKGKAKMHYEGKGQNQDFSANIRMAKDSVIWVHITAGMGLINVARIYITPDSFQLVNYLEKSGMKMPISEAGKMLPASVDFSVLQNLIIGDALSSKGTATDATDMDGAWSLNMTDPDVNQQASYNKADSTMRSLQVVTKNGVDFEGLILYNNYSIISDKKFAIDRDINIKSKNELHLLDMTFNNASFDEVIDFPFAIPEGYSLNK